MVGTNHVQFFVDERKDNLMEEEGDEDVVFGEDVNDIHIHGDEEDGGDEDDHMSTTEPGQEVVSIWDLLVESFLQEVS